MNKSEISQQLDQLATLYDQLEAIRKDEQKAVNALVPQELKQQIDDVHLEMAPKIRAIMGRITGLEGLIQGETAKLEETIKGKRLTAIFQKGRFTWDGKKLMEYAKENYRILSFRKQGDPSVRITKNVDK